VGLRFLGGFWGRFRDSEGELHEKSILGKIGIKAEKAENADFAENRLCVQNSPSES
jgi:hypothetical protein